MIPVSKTLETDIAVVGGGIGGLCAAIAAAEGGARVMVLEKANTKRSGSGATGNDHFACYYPKHHGGDIRPILRELLDSLVGLCHDPLLSLRFLERSISIVDKWHEWGINMKPFAEDYVFMGHAYPDRPRIWLKYDGHNQKEALTRQAKKVGVTIVNHHPAVDLMRDEQGITGVLALDVSGETPSFTFVKARKVILATGTANRLYPAAGSPGWPFNTAFCPACAGAAQAQGWRIGAKLVNMELPNRHAGPKFFARAGKSTWIGVYRYPDGKLLGPFVDKATREVGDITCDVWNSAYTDVLMNGTGPAYIDCTGTGPEDMAFMREGMASEGLTGLLNYMDEKGIDPSKHAVEFMQYEPHLIGRGLEIDIDGQTSVPGLYATGDMVGNFRADIAGAAVYDMTEPADNALTGVIGFVGSPAIALLIALLVSVCVFGPFNGRPMREVADSMAGGARSMAMILLVIAAGGAFKEVLTAAGIADYIKEMTSGWSISPIILAWLIAVILRIALGSASVAVATAAGIAAPLVADSGVSPEVMVLATACGSVAFSHVNDPGFWMFKEYFNLTVTEAIKVRTTYTTVLSVLGLGGCLVLGALI